MMIDLVSKKKKVQSKSLGICRINGVWRASNKEAKQLIELIKMKRLKKCKDLN